MNPIIKNIDKYFRIIFLRKKKFISPIIFIILLGKIFMTTLVVQDQGTSCVSIFLLLEHCFCLFL